MSNEMEIQNPKSEIRNRSYSSLLLEIGLEEMPARFLPPALSMLKDNVESIFGEHLIEFSDIKTYATPRRLSLLIGGIPQLQKDSLREVLGPPQKAAFDKDGNPTRAAIGFAQSQGVEVSSLVIRQKDKGEYVAAIIKQGGNAVREMLQDVLRKLILSLNFPKTMRWGNGNLRFVRPIHWIVALFDGDTISFDLDGVKSGNITRGHRFLSPGAFAIKDITSYINVLENNYVIVDPEARKRIIEKGMTGLASSVEGEVLKDEGLLETVANLVEYPVPVLCEFSPEYLRLPKELLITVMKDHQKYFSIKDGGGRLKNFFIVVSNTKDENANTIKTGAERVIRARFEDARFYYEEDIKKPLHLRLEDLKRVTFHDKLGTLYDKTGRVVKLACFLSGRLFPDKKKLIERAAWLCKTDLITGVVGEFPELQGLMGSYYAVHDGEEKEVAKALGEQYLPAYSGDKLPETDEGSILSLSDKMDNIVSFFSVGLSPTGSEDPFALRRQAIGVIAILFEKGYDVSLKEVIENATKDIRHSPALSEDLSGFLSQRIESLFASRDYETDIIQSVMYFANELPLHDIKARIDAVKRFGAENEYNNFLLALKRISNIVPKIEMEAAKEDLLQEDQEKNLFGEIRKIGPAISASLKDKKYYEALMSLSTITGSINNFFDKVLVMDKREEVKLNRLALLKEIWATASMIADFSKLRENR